MGGMQRYEGKKKKSVCDGGMDTFATRRSGRWIAMVIIYKLRVVKNERLKEVKTEKCQKGRDERQQTRNS
jgi:hypothetical protein